MMVASSARSRSGSTHVHKHAFYTMCISTTGLKHAFPVHVYFYYRDKACFP